jgi:hypothetical protein
MTHAGSPRSAAGCRHRRLFLWVASVILLVASVGRVPTMEKLHLAAAQTTDPPELRLDWTAPQTSFTKSLAWGDVDNDGDLDLAFGNGGVPSQLYRNTVGSLTLDTSWTPITATTTSVAWGDVDGDGDLDLALGNSGEPSQLYRNQAGRLLLDTSWTPITATTTSVAWGDVDGDGDLDLALGNSSEPSQLYRNQAGDLLLDTSWTPITATTTSVAWGDVDGDADLDLAFGNSGEPSQLYRNTGGALSLDTNWNPITATTNAIAWGDVDGDADLDLALGNDGRSQLYRNDGGILTLDDTFVTDDSLTHSIAWGDLDADGDLDLAIGLYGRTQLYRNTAGVLDLESFWLPPATATRAVAWGDVNGDGLLDLALANDLEPSQLHLNEGSSLQLDAQWAPVHATTTDADWGDVDGDGDLDLAVSFDCYNGPPCRSVQLYLNQNGTLATLPNWSSDASFRTFSIAWGDVDGDGDLDLAVGNNCFDTPGCRTQLYRNQGGILSLDTSWVSIPALTTSIAWGDVDNDGDLDLVLGNVCFGDQCGLQLYRNEGGVLSLDTSWVSARDPTNAITLGDVDNDGDLDLAVGNFPTPNRLYRNKGGSFVLDTSWLPDAARTVSVAWGDVDSDGDLDLAVGNEGQSNQLYRNSGGILILDRSWNPPPNLTRSVSWGDVDGDGDLDLAVGNADSSRPSQLYRNDGGNLLPIEWPNQPSIAQVASWGDVDRDGDLDLALIDGRAPSRLYYNTRDLASSADAPHTVRLFRPSATDEANFFSTPELITSQFVPISYTLRHPFATPVQHVIGEYSLDGGGLWHLAVPTSDTITTNLAAPTAGATYTFTWDIFASGIFGQSDNLVFRLRAIPSVGPRPNRSNATPTRWIYGESATVTFPFRLRGTQVRVTKEDGNAASNALVYRLPGGLTRGAMSIADAGGLAFQTDTQGFLAGRGSLAVSDKLVALLPISTTETYTLYHTSAAIPGELSLTEVLTPGVQTLTVRPANPLVTFNLSVSLEWDARRDAIFLAQLTSDLRRAGELLYDWTNGQMTLGDLIVYHDKQHWDDAHIRVYATNRLRPNANQGGIVSQELADPDVSAISYEPGQVRMGATWNRYGDAAGNLGEDWPRTLAHELGHFALFLDDNYLGLDAAGRLISLPADKPCPGAMSDPYRDDWSEFHPRADWLPDCATTLSNQETGRADWETIQRFYPMLAAPNQPFSGVNSGPTTLPLVLTHVRFIEPTTATTTLDAPVFSLRTSAGQRYNAFAQGVRAFLFRGNRISDLGSPIGDQLLARGAQPGDRLCVYALSAQPPALGCEPVVSADQELTLHPSPDWQPDIRLTPVTSRTLLIGATGIPTNLSLKAALYPGYVAPGTPTRYEISLTPSADGYEGSLTISGDEPPLEGFVQLWVDEQGVRREIVTDYTIGGNPGKRRNRPAPRGNPGKRRNRPTPVVSSDGQVILYGKNLNLSEGQFYVLQTTSRLPEPPSWATVVGQGYRLTASATAPLTGNLSLNLSYLQRDVPGSEEAGIRVYFRGEGSSEWIRLDDSTPDVERNEVAVQVRGPGLYVLMTSVEVPLASIGWNQIPYVVADPTPRLVAMALRSIAGQYTTVYAYNPADSGDPWKVYGVAAPLYVNDLEALENGRSYWIYATVTTTLLLKGGPTPTASSTAPGIPTPPATYYGNVDERLSIPPETTLIAHVGDTVCGRGSTMVYDSQIVYVIDVLNDGSFPSCGASGRLVRLSQEGNAQPLALIPWSRSGLQQLNLGSGQISYLPLLRR